MAFPALLLLSMVSPWQRCSAVISSKKGVNSMVSIGYRLFVLTALWASLTACAGGISKQARSQVTYFDTFSQLQQEPERYRGETVMLGGKIVDVQIASGETTLVVLQLELAGNTRPADSDTSQGRFLVKSDQFIDPALYPLGTQITVVGHLTGSEIRNIGQMPYRYPVVDIIEIKKWAPNSGAGPRFHFGIGVGTRF
jgi:outer membrane lipoprotein